MQTYPAPSAPETLPMPSAKPAASSASGESLESIARKAQLASEQRQRRSAERASTSWDAILSSPNTFGSAESLAINDSSRNLGLQDLRKMEREADTARAAPRKIPRGEVIEVGPPLQSVQPPLSPQLRALLGQQSFNPKAENAAPTPLSRQTTLMPRQWQMTVKEPQAAAAKTSLPAVVALPAPASGADPQVLWPTKPGSAPGHGMTTSR